MHLVNCHRNWEETNQIICNCLDELTTREMEVMVLVVAGRSNKEIARQLEISHRTVEIHRAQVMKKTGVANVLELARLYDICQLPPQTAPPELA